MDTLLERYSLSLERFNFGDGSASTNLDHPSDSNTYLSSGSDGDTTDISDYNRPVIKYISDILLEEDLEGKPCMLQDCLTLQAAEKSFYDVLNQKDPLSPNQPPLSVHQSFENSDDDSPHSCHNSNASIAAKTNWVFDPSETSKVQSSLVQSLPDAVLDSDSLSEMQRLEYFGGLREASKFLPKVKFETIDLKGSQLMPPGLDQWPLATNTLMRRPDNDDYSSTNRSKGKKNHQRDDGDYPEEGRSNKQPVAFADDSEPQEMFDEVLLCLGNHEFESCSNDESLITEGSGKLQHKKQSKGSKTRDSKKQNNNRELVDLSTLLTQCAQAVASYDQRTASAQAVASYDQRTASELLKQIRQHSSPYGDATQRLAHYFADGLEARLAGARTPSYSPLISMQISAAEILKAYEVFVTSSPFRTVSNFLANRTILKLAEKATRLHVIDFGISYGFQWPCFIHHLSKRPGGPPKLRITAIELPQPGFRPTEKVEETGRRLQKYAERFNVPFEYNVIAQKWETIQFEDLKIDRNEMIVVNCMNRLRHIPDDTVMVNSPRDIVLKLIKKINPDLFIHGVVNGTYNSPFFVTRFREALFHFSALFDVFEASVPREDERRLMFEKAVYGKDILNVVACEGLERVERPETYKQWQVRNVRAGFKQLPLDQEILKKVERMLKFMGYHNDFRIDEEGHWILQGWKGRTIMALSFWKKA
ncbi:scarecrow-like protein 30 isoform X1 [Prunus dulcis]|uniref:scarecrow-like protein 30 isoform X1 n=1 Tax=Prunus dulcis TaxID=3755 RepID=UPI001481F196|nr:scarecrow-like protein 30 isoform X1 [Prunus dulcis]